jgi:BirA family biotin operon repressor/biotin-[acetyl-CoA-carboxylase] ligase
MSPSPNAPDLAALDAALGPLAPIFDIRWVESSPSTNSELMEAPPGNGRKIDVLVATAQTAGRGRRGRHWLAWPGSSLTFSVRWRFAPTTPAPGGLSLVVGLALAHALDRLGTRGVALKWPNDVLVHGRKIAGILIELIAGRDHGITAVIGIGLNLCLPAEAAIPGQGGGITDLARELGKTVTRETVLASVLTELHPLLVTYARTGFPLLRDVWRQHDAFAGQPVRVSGENEEIVGLCAGVDDDGALLVKNGRGLTRILAGDVSLRRAP